jgi:hypothetical protein
LLNLHTDACRDVPGISANGSIFYNAMAAPVIAEVLALQ